MFQKLKYGLIGLLLGLGLFLPLYGVFSSDMRAISPWYQSGTGVYLATPVSQVFFPNGSATAPSMAFVTDPGTGFSLPSPNVIDTIIGGGLCVRTYPSAIWVYDDAGSLRLGLARDVIMIRDAANTLAQKNANFDQAQRWYGANGAYFQVATQSELLTIGAGASTNTTMSIPANSIVRGVAVYVVTVIPVAANFTVTGTTSTTVFNTAAVSTVAGSNDVGTQNTPYKNGAAQTITITPNVPPLAATGQVRIVLMYEIPFAPTS